MRFDCGAGTTATSAAESWRERRREREKGGRARAVMGGRASSLASAAGRQEAPAAASAASKRKLPKFAEGGAGAGAGAGTKAAEAGAPAPGGEGAPSATTLEGLRMQAMEEEASVRPRGQPEGKDASLDDMLRQLSGAIREKTVAIPVDPQARAHASRLKADVQREVNRHRVSAADLERLLVLYGDRKEARGAARALEEVAKRALEEKGVPAEVMESVLKHVRLPADADYVQPDATSPQKYQ